MGENNHGAESEEIDCIETDVTHRMDYKLPTVVEEEYEGFKLLHRTRKSRHDWKSSATYAYTNKEGRLAVVVASGCHDPGLSEYNFILGYSKGDRKTRDEIVRKLHKLVTNVKWLPQPNL